jgi:SNF2 family DNA or RNA helicase
MCRSVIKPKELVYISKGDEEEKKEEKKQKETKPKQKHETVVNILQEGLKLGKKYLVFSMFDESFSIIRREMAQHSIDYVEISGSKATRILKIKKFKEGKVNVVFLNSRFNGAGINLENATDIILYHEMPPAIREQVIGRALRIGREGDLTVHNLCF